MAKRSNITRPIHARGGPVTLAIAAVREPVAPFLVAVSSGDPMVSGWYVGRRHDWIDLGREELIWLDVQSDGSGWLYGVWRCGGPKSEDPADWSFTTRVFGVRSMPEDMLDLEATRR